MEEKKSVKRIKGHLLNPDCSKEHLHTNPSPRQVLHNKQFTNKRTPTAFEILFWLLQCQSVFSSTNKGAQSPHGCGSLCKHNSHGRASFVYMVTDWHFCSYLPSPLPCWYRQMLFLSTALQSEPGHTGKHSLLSGSFPERC